MSDPKPLSQTKPLQTVLERGVYKAILIEYCGTTWNGRYSFKIILDVDYGGDHPLRLWHFVNAKYCPGISIANIAGYLCNDQYLQRLTPEILQSQPSVSGALSKTWCNVMLDISKFSGKNDVIGLFPPSEIVAELKQQVQMFVEEPKQTTKLQPIEESEVPF